MPKDNIVNKLVASIKEVADQLGVSPVVLTKAQFLEASGIAEWELRKVGGYSSLIKTYFPFEDKDLASIVDNKQKQSYVRKLEKKIGEVSVVQRDFPRILSDVVQKHAVIKPLILDSKATKAHLQALHEDPTDKTDTCKRSVCTIWSDQHFGTNFTKEDTHNLNAYNWTVSARRLAMLCDQLATFKIEKRENHEELVIFMLGDNIAGVINDQEGNHVDLSADQVWGTAGYYIQAITYLLNFFPSIRIEVQTGNHGRVMHKQSKDRAMQAKWDSFETTIATTLVAAFASDRRVQIHIPKAPYCDTEIQGHRIYGTHGDTVFNVGNPGKTVPLEKIHHQISNINGNLPASQKKYEMFVTGHVHHPVMSQVGGVKVLINGSLMGTDPYALSIGITDNNPTQVMWETTRRYVQGTLQQVYAVDADTADKKTHERFDKIITPYQTAFGEFFSWWK